jgi:hypothetical protein
MLIKRRLAVAVIVACALLFAVARTGILRKWGKASKPLGEALRINSPSVGLSQSQRQQFLEGDFAIVKDVKALPHQLVDAFTERGGSRLLMANPDQTFEVTDVIGDESVPRERLIFAGVFNDKCFVQYEKGGYAHTYILSFFDMTPTSGVKMVWQGYCTAAATSFQDLRLKITNGGCY